MFGGGKQYVETAFVTRFPFIDVFFLEIEINTNPMCCVNLHAYQ